MIQTNELFNLKALKALKTSLPCYGVVPKTRFFEGELKHFKTSCVFDFGFKHQYKTLAVNQSNLSIHKIKDLIQGQIHSSWLRQYILQFQSRRPPEFQH